MLIEGLVTARIGAASIFRPDKRAKLARMGPLEIVLIVVVIALVFGAKKLPELGKGMGQGIREFKKEVRDEHTPSAGAVPLSDMVVDVPSRQLDSAPVVQGSVSQAATQPVGDHK